MNARTARLAPLVLALAMAAAHAAAHAAEPVANPAAGSRGNPADALVGCYGSAPDGAPGLVVKATADGYVLEGVGPAYKLYPPRWKPGSEDDPMRAQVEVALVAEMPVFSMIKLKPGAVLDGELAETPYYFGAPQVGGFVHRVPCAD